MIYVARHGQTQWNVEKRICGHADVKLTDAGYQQAEELAKLVAQLKQPVSKIICSPLIRAKETARIIAEANHLSMEIDERLIEMNFGKFDGLYINTPEFQKVRVEFSLPFEQGESILDVSGRVYPLLDELAESDETVLLVCHNALLRVIDNYFNGKTMEEFLNFHCSNTELRKYEY